MDSVGTAFEPVRVEDRILGERCDAWPPSGTL